MAGKLYGVGVGPGDPELLTLKAHRIITSTPVIAYPAPDNGESFARSIAAQYIKGSQKEIPVIVPMRVDRFPAKNVYDQAASAFSAELDSGNNIAFLCEGDPFFYGSFMYVYERLALQYECEIIPGISSLMASAAVAGRPLAARNDVLSVVPAPVDDEQIMRALNSRDAICFIKVGRHLDRVRELIDQAGLLDQAVYLERVTLNNQKRIPLRDIQGAKAPYFSIILIYQGAEGWVSHLPVSGETP